MTNKEELLYLARLSEQSERYDEMVVYATQFSKESKSELSVEERNILSVAYKNVVGQRRAAWRVLHSIQQKESRKANETNVQRVITYKQIIEKELRDFCYEVLKLLDTILISLASTGEAKVFYRKMKGDYYRYICEFATENEKETSQQEALKAYQQAYEIAQNELTPTHPVRLGLTLNFSVFYYETMEDTEKAIEMAKTAFDEAIAELDHVTEESYKDSTLIMQLLRDNLTLWTSDLNEDRKLLCRAMIECSYFHILKIYNLTTKYH